MFFVLPLLGTLLRPASAGDLSVRQAEVDAASPAAAVGDLDGSVDAYVAHALADSPRLRAAHARWAAAVQAIPGARALPEPTLSFGVFLQSVETRVGPQQARLGLQQALPWPSGLRAAGDLADADARAAAAAFEAVGLQVAADVRDAWWRLWALQQTRRVHREHLAVLDGLSHTLRARVEVGGASLADLQQVDLSRARLADGIDAMDEEEPALAAALRAAAGLRTSSSPPLTGDALLPSFPQAAPDELVGFALAHPTFDALGARVDGAEAMRRQAVAGRLPSFSVGLDWIITGPADPSSEHGVPADSGKDALMLGAGLRLPLWQGVHARRVQAAAARADAARADVDAAADLVAAQVAADLAAVRDSARRVAVVEGTLLPQAEAAHASVLGAYTAGRGGIAAVLLAQQDLLELRVQLDQQRARHARAWASLEARCGRELAHVPATPSESP